MVAEYWRMVEARAEIVTGEEAARGMQLLNKRYFPWKQLLGFFASFSRRERTVFVIRQREKEAASSDGSEVSRSARRRTSPSNLTTFAQMLERHYRGQSHPKVPAVSKLYRSHRGFLENHAPRLAFQMPLTKVPGHKQKTRRCQQRESRQIVRTRATVWPAR